MTAPAIESPSARYNFDIFKARGVPEHQLCGTPYRYWHSHALAYILGGRLSGTVDVLDAGGGAGPVLDLLKNLGLRGTYTCLDLAPRIVASQDAGLKVQSIAGSFQDFIPPRFYDAVLFQTCLEYIADYRQIAWVSGCLKPRGFVVVILQSRNTRLLYRSYRKKGAVYSRDPEEMAPAFAHIGLRIVNLFALCGLASRFCQYVTNSSLPGRAQSGIRRSAGLLLPPLRRADLHAPLNRFLNPVMAGIDRLLPVRPIGHCLVLEPANRS